MASNDNKDDFAERLIKRKAYENVSYQRECLMNLFERLRDVELSSLLTELTALLRQQHPVYLPPVGDDINSTGVVIHFDEKKVPHFEFRLGRPLDAPAGVDVHVAFYSKGIYQILKKKLDREEDKKVEQEVVVSTVEEEAEEEPKNEDGQQAKAHEESKADNRNSLNLSNNSPGSNERPPSPINGQGNSSTSEPSYLNVDLNVDLNADLNVPIKEELNSSFNSFVDKRLTSLKHSGNIFSKRKTISDHFEASKSLSKKRLSNAVNRLNEPTSSTSFRSVFAATPTTSTFTPNLASTSTSTPTPTLNTTSENVTSMTYERAYELAISAKPTTNNNCVICPICSTPKYRLYILEHLNVVHFGKKPWHCKWPGCKFEAGQEGNADKHVKKHHLDPIKSTESPKNYVEFVEYID